MLNCTGNLHCRFRKLPFCIRFTVILLEIMSCWRKFTVKDRWSDLSCFQVLPCGKDKIKKSKHLKIAWHNSYWERIMSHHPKQWNGILLSSRTYPLAPVYTPALSVIRNLQTKWMMFKEFKRLFEGVWNVTVLLNGMNCSKNQTVVSQVFGIRKKRMSS